MSDYYWRKPCWRCILSRAVEGLAGSRTWSLPDEYWVVKDFCENDSWWWCGNYVFGLALSWNVIGRMNVITDCDVSSRMSATTSREKGRLQSYDHYPAELEMWIMWILEGVEGGKEGTAVDCSVSSYWKNGRAMSAFWEGVACWFAGAITCPLTTAVEPPSKRPRSISRAVIVRTSPLA